MTFIRNISDISDIYQNISDKYQNVLIKYLTNVTW